jgi:uncharacterized membrane protein
MLPDEKRTPAPARRTTSLLVRVCSTAVWLVVVLVGLLVYGTLLLLNGRVLAGAIKLVIVFILGTADVVAMRSSPEEGKE